MPVRGRAHCDGRWQRRTVGDVAPPDRRCSGGTAGAAGAGVKVSTTLPRPPSSLSPFLHPASACKEGGVRGVDGCARIERLRLSQRRTRAGSRQGAIHRSAGARRGVSSPTHPPRPCPPPGWCLPRVGEATVALLVSPPPSPSRALSGRPQTVPLTGSPPTAPHTISPTPRPTSWRRLYGRSPQDKAPQQRE